MVDRGSLAVTQLGMVSSLGLDVLGSCAAARAGLVRPAELDQFILDPDTSEPVALVGHPVGDYTLGFSELGLWTRLGSLALRNLLMRCEGHTPTLSRTAVLINAPSGYYLQCAQEARARRSRARSDPDDGDAGPSYEELLPLYEAELIPKILGALDLRERPAVQRVTFEDETGAISVLSTARHLLGSGQVTQCIVGGIDSLIDAHWLVACDDLGVLKTAQRPVGFMPGEGAAFLLLETEEHARRRGAPVLATISGLASREEPAHRFAKRPPSGIALAGVISDSLQQTGAPCSTFFCDLNGDPARASDWGCAQARLSRDVQAPTSVPLAASFGATRSAYGLMAACAGIFILAQDRRRPESVLIWTSSDSGRRGSFLMRRSAGGGKTT